MSKLARSMIVFLTLPVSVAVLAAIAAPVPLLTMVRVARAEAADAVAKPTDKSDKATKVAAPAKAARLRPGAKASGKAAPDDKDVPVSTPPAASSPLAELKKSNDQLDKLLKKKYPNWSPEADAQKSDVQRLVGGFLDYRELAHRSLAKHWETLTAPQRVEFVSTLRELVERSYLKQVRGDPSYNIKYVKEEKAGSEATVEATLTTMTRNKKVEIALVYKMVYKDRWLVYDVITDEQSMLENYRAEFNKIINKDGFDALLKRMKKKLDEKDE
jgi:phospholipid transport system substrate-binding protein